MSTYYAIFDDGERAAQTVDRLLRAGVRPEDLSLLRNGVSIPGRPSDDPNEAKILMANDTVGDATAFVGRADDPEEDSPLRPGADITVLTTIEQSRISPIDTSVTGLDVETVDQTDDSQREAELWITPTRGIPQGAHEKDDLALTVTTGFPTRPPEEDHVRDGETPSQEHLTQSLEVIEIPGFGAVYGGGELATAALDFARPDRERNDDPLTRFLLHEGIPEDSVRQIEAEFRRGRAVLAVLATPGQVDEDAVEQIVEASGGRGVGLFDAPSYRDGDGQATLR